MEFTAAGGEIGTEGRPGNRLHGTRRREPKGTGELVSERIAGLQGGGKKTTREPGTGVRSRRGDCIAAFSGNDHAAGGDGRTEEMRRGLHAGGGPGSRRRSAGVARRQGRRGN